MPGAADLERDIFLSGDFVTEEITGFALVILVCHLADYSDGGVSIDRERRRTRVEEDDMHAWPNTALGPLPVM